MLYYKSAQDSVIIAKGSQACEKDMRASIPFGSGISDNCINVV